MGFKDTFKFDLENKSLYHVYSFFFSIGENREMGVKTAQRFLKVPLKHLHFIYEHFQELRHKPGLDYKFQLMENFILLASGNKQNVQQALGKFLESVGDVTPGQTSVVSFCSE